MVDTSRLLADPYATMREVEPATPRLRWHRLLVAHVLIAVILGVHLYCIAAKVEWWPFSRYPMYSSIQGQKYSINRFYGVADGKELLLNPSTHFAPFDGSRLLWSVNGMKSRSQKRAAGEWFLRRYEELRARGRHDGPPIDELRVYREVWRLDAKNPRLTSPRQRKKLYSFKAKTP